MIEALVAEFERLPRLMRLGLIVFIFGGLLEVLYNLAPTGWALFLDDYLRSNGSVAHLVTLAGMVVIMLGVFRVAFARANEKENNHAE